MKTTHITIDIVIAQLVEKGGLDKVLNDVLPFLQESGYHIRLIQLVDYGIKWIKSGIENYSIRHAENAGSFRDAAEGYALFIKEHGKPNMVIATGWPVVVTITRTALNILNYSDVIVLAWPHMQLYEGSHCGVGGVECMADADAVFSICHEIRHEILKVFPTQSVIPVKNPIDLKAFPYNSKRNKHLLAFVGRLIDSKNIHLIFQAMQKSGKNFNLIVAGDGEMEKTKQLCKLYHLENQVEFLGWVDNPWHELQNAGWLIVSSDYEGFSLVIVEALASGMPVISTPVGIAPEVIIPGQNGYLYPIKDSDNLAAVLDYIWEGQLPCLDSEICQKSALCYDKDIVLKDFIQKLNNVFENFGVKQ